MKMRNMLNLGDIFELNTKGKMPLASSEEMESNETIVSIDGDRVYDLVREGNLCFNCSNIFVKYLNNL
jgi:hypothetical protein